MKYYLGIDIGGTKCAVVLGGEKSSSVGDKIKFPTEAGKGWKSVVRRIIEKSRELLERNGAAASQVAACGVCCGGPLDSEKGVITRPPNLPDWDGVPLADIINEELGIPCKVRNDADACALAEWRFGAGRGCKNMIFLTFGTGMGAGLILNGELYTGASGLAGEVGHIRLDSDGPVAYGKAGSFEGFCSGAGIAAAGKKALSIYNGKTLIPYEDVSAKTIAEAAYSGDKLANAIYRRCGEKLGLGLSVLIDVLNPEKIIIGGVFRRAGCLMLESMNETIKKEALEISARRCEIVPAALGEEIGDFAALGVAEDFAEGKK